jgi:hypothetical protein
MATGSIRADTTYTNPRPHTELCARARYPQRARSRTRARYPQIAHARGHIRMPAKTNMQQLQQM